MVHVDGALVKEVFVGPERQRKPDLNHFRKADDLWTGLGAANGTVHGHPWTLGKPLARLKSVISEKAPQPRCYCNVLP